eukprot:TRINITY_DN36220_c0_g1_i1.p1 TRINITY_DN36220_c0_g1~~TRINITY_DN36220_c0_g1_i1.p1  ORF type:complete len:498 (+),score=80.13 TRINITY_DN36220_c0_g1_i1:142-1635(+)
MLACFTQASFQAPQQGMVGARSSSSSSARPALLSDPSKQGTHSTSSHVDVPAGAFCAAATASVAVAVAAKRRKHHRARKQAARIVARASSNPQFDSLVDWVKSNGAYVSDAVTLVGSDGVEGEGGDKRGTVATRAIKAGERIMEFPVGCCLSPRQQPVGNQLDPEIARALDRAGAKETDMNLAITLAEERLKGEASPWNLYNTMVTCDHTFPLFYEEGELEVLENHPLQESIKTVSEMVSVVAKKNGLPDEALREAWQLVKGRRFASDTCAVMIPVGDFLNHSLESSCAWDFPTPQHPDSWTLKAKHDIKEGEPLTFTYCEDPNHLLVGSSGFVLPENPNNRIMVRPCDLRQALLKISNPSSPFQFAEWRKTEIFKQLPDPEEEGVGLGMFLVGRVPNGIQWNPLWLNLVGLAITQSPDAVWNKLPDGNKQFIEAIEAASWSIFNSGLEADLSTDVSAASPNVQLAAAFRRSYKKLMQEALTKLRQNMGVAVVDDCQ